MQLYSSGDLSGTTGGDLGLAEVLPNSNMSSHVAAVYTWIPNFPQGYCQFQIVAMLDYLIFLSMEMYTDVIEPN